MFNNVEQMWQQNQLMKQSSPTCNTCWSADATWALFVLDFFFYLPVLHFLSSSSRQLNSLQKCFVGKTSGCCCQGAFDLISVMQRKKKFFFLKRKTTTICLEVCMELHSRRRGHLSPQGRVDACSQWGHEDTPALHRLGEKTQLEYINEWSIFFLPARHFLHPSAWRELFFNCWTLLTPHYSLFSSITVSLLFSLWLFWLLSGLEGRWKNSTLSQMGLDYC